MSGRVLIADNDKSFVKGLKYSLEQDDYQIDIVYNASSALEYIGKRAYDIVLMDILLPDGNGLSLCQNIRSTSNVPIIFITEVNEDIKKILALEYGADDYLVKPLLTPIKFSIARCSAV